ncbi:MAG: response regulator transcription factor, partial [Anaerolineales bacterium]|nr:response regulator transcription factor [Anaerolineales bacterium]
MEEGKTIQVLVADDHQIVRQGLRLIFETTPSIDLVGEATNGQEAVDLAAELRPDVILMDMKMPVMDGIQAIRRIGAAQPEMAVIILTTFEDDEMMLAGLQEGARAFLLKDTRRQALVRTIQAAARGESLLSPEIMARLLAHTGKPEPTPDTAQAG